MQVRICLAMKAEPGDELTLGQVLARPHLCSILQLWLHLLISLHLRPHFLPQRCITKYCTMKHGDSDVGLTLQLS